MARPAPGPLTPRPPEAPCISPFSRFVFHLSGGRSFISVAAVADTTRAHCPQFPRPQEDGPGPTSRRTACPTRADMRVASRDRASRSRGGCHSAPGPALLPLPRLRPACAHAEKELQLGRPALRPAHAAPLGACPAPLRAGPGPSRPSPWLLHFTWRVCLSCHRPQSPRGTNTQSPLSPESLRCPRSTRDSCPAVAYHPKLFSSLRSVWQQ